MKENVGYAELGQNCKMKMQKICVHRDGEIRNIGYRDMFEIWNVKSTIMMLDTADTYMRKSYILYIYIYIYIANNWNSLEENLSVLR